MQYSLSNLHALPRSFVELKPTVYEAEALSLVQCREIVSASQVLARGWYFPHINRDAISVGSRGMFVNNETDGGVFSRHIERWRMYRSGHFLFTAKLWEVPGEEIQERMRANMFPDRRSDIEGFISFIGQIYSISEAYVFAARLAQGIPYRTPVDVTVGLRNVRGWSLGSNEPAVDLSAYVTALDAPEHTAEIEPTNLIADPLGLAVDATIGIFQQFGWLDPSAGMIENWQRQIFRNR
jgi:hypothetical protein